MEEIMSLLLGRRNIQGSNRPRHLAYFTEVSADSVTTGNTKKKYDMLSYHSKEEMNEAKLYQLFKIHLCKILFLNIQVIFIAIRWIVEMMVCFLV